MNHHSSRRKNIYSPIIGTALATVSLFYFSFPVFAVGTDAGLELKNRATATYDDGTTPYETISNEVTVTVGKIAGVTNVPGTFTDNTSSATNTTVLPGDSISFDFIVTNTGNDSEDIFIPDATVLNGNATNFTVTDIEYSTDDGATFNPRSANGVITDVDENASITVRVNGTVSDSANVGDEIQVRLGDTGDNTADVNDPDFPNTQNQPDDGGATDPQNEDVRTLTTADGNGDVDGDPVNGQKEASATHIISIGSNPLALTRIKKTNSGVDTNSTPDDITDDLITYNLELDVLSQKLASYNNFNSNPAALEGRDYSTSNNITIAGTTGGDTQSNLILVSDIVPEYTDILPTSVNAPANWIPVYTTSPLTTPADEATWTDDPSTLTATDITRVGWVYDARATAGDGKIAPNSTVTGFNFQVQINETKDTPNLTATSNQAIYGLAQVFGSTDDGTDDDNASTGTTTFDESGDQNPNNLNDDGTAGTTEENSFTTVGGNDLFGYADPGTGEDNIDTAGDNTQTGSAGGEVNKVVVAPGPVTPDILNGPANLPQATGAVCDIDPASNNNDFQNVGVAPAVAADQITEVAAGNDNDTSAATVIDFTNTVQNTQTGANTILLEPISPGDTDFNVGCANTDLPDGTTVAITFGGNTATYTYTQGAAGTPGSFTTSDTPISLGSVAGGASESYDVKVTLPADTLFSTEESGGTEVGGYPVPIVAYVNDNGTAGLQNDDTYNITVDQAYLGYLKLVKQARILRDENGDTMYTVVPGMDFADPDTDKTPGPGDIIEYRVTYSNISEPQGTGSNNVTLDAENISINEDGTGTTVTANTWAKDGPDDDDTIIDTLHVPTKAVDSNGGTVTYFSGATGNSASTDANREVTKYVDKVNLVAPGDSGTFTFQRKVTDESDIEDLTQ